MACQRAPKVKTVIFFLLFSEMVPTKVGCGVFHIESFSSHLSFSLNLRGFRKGNGSCESCNAIHKRSAPHILCLQPWSNVSSQIKKNRCSWLLYRHPAWQNLITDSSPGGVLETLVMPQFFLFTFPLTGAAQRLWFHLLRRSQTDVIHTIEVTLDTI